MRLKILTYALLLFGSKGLYAQTVTVLDKSTLQPIEGVNVNNTTTNEKGQVELSAVQVDKVNPIYIFSKSGYFGDSLTESELKSADYKVMLAERTFDFIGTVVTVTRFQEKASEIPQQVTIITKRDIQFMNQPTTADLLQQSGRAFIQKSQMAGGSVTMRSFEANKVLMVVDGVRMNNAIYRGGHLQNVISVDQNMLENAEMIFGPGSVMYGSDALGGVIHFHTRNPVLGINGKPLVKAMAYTRYSTAMDEKTGHIDFNIGLGKVAFLTSFTYSSFGDLTIGKKGTKGYESWGRRTFYSQRFGNKDSMLMNPDSFSQIPTGYTQTDLMEKILYKQNEHVSHQLNLQYSATGDFPRYDRLTELTGSGKPSQAQWYYGPQVRTLASYNLTINGDYAAFDKGVLIVAYQDIKESRHNRGFGSSSLTHREEQVKVKTVNGDFHKMMSSRTELRYGFELMDNDVQSTAKRENINTGAFTAQSTRYPDGGSVMRHAAVYVSQNTRLSKNTILNAGIRFTDVYLKSVFNDKTFFPFLGNSIEQRNQNTSGNIGIVHTLNSWRFAANIATGFRAANVDDMAKVFESVGGRIIIPNAYVKPEQTMTYELTVNKDILNKLDIEANVYYTQFSNALTLGRAQLNGKDTITYNGTLSSIYSTQNAQNAYIYGYYIGFTYDISKKLAISGNINYTYGRIKTDTVDYPLDHISPVFGRWSVMYKSKKWKAEFFSVFNGAKKSADYNLVGEDNAIYSADPVKGHTPAWYTLNLRGFYQFGKYLQFQLAVENLLDQHYRTFSSGTSAAGRNFVLTLRGTF